MSNPTCQGGFCLGTPAPDGTPCTFLPNCFTQGQCLFGLCVGSLPVFCPDDGDPCTIDFCNSGTGRCESFGKCFSTPCSTSTCDTAGNCTERAINEGGSCDDFDECTTNTHCQAGFCVGGPAGGPTVTPTSTTTPTATVTPMQTACVGDCGGDGAVTVDEILTLVNIALGNIGVEACESGDPNGDDQVTVDEILTAVNAALNGCPT